MYQFLDNFHQRMEQVAVHQFLNEKASIREGLRQGFFEEEALNLYMQLLCFIMEKSLLEQSCTLSDMETFLIYILGDREYEIETQMEKETIDYTWLTRYLVRDALQNKGKPYYFDTYNFKEKHKMRIHVRLIEDKIVVIEGQEEFSYHLTAQGYEFLFGTLEVEESLQMSFEQLKLQYAIQKRNFSSAKDSVDNLFTLNRKQIQQIREYIIRIKEDIGLFTTKDYENTYSATFDTLTEQREKHEELYGLITRTKEQYIEQNLSTSNTVKIEEDLSNIDYIKTRLQQLLGEQIKLFNEQQTLGEVYDEAISNVLYIGFENRLSIEKDIIEPMEEMVESLKGMAKILRPLMKPNLNKQFNFAKAYASQKIESDEENTTDEVYYLEKGEDELSEIIEKRIAYVQDEYQNIVKKIIIGVRDSDDEGIRLSQLFDETKDIELFRNVLVQIHSDEYLDMKTIQKESLEHIYEPGEDFDFGYSYAKVLKQIPAIKKMVGLNCSTIKEERVIIRGSVDKKYLKCHDLIFREVKE